MTSQDVLALYNNLERMSVEIWVDGGWGVDALLGQQTRPHADLDIAIEERNVPKLREALREEGYEETRRDSEHNFVLQDKMGHQVDVHAFIRDASGNVVGGIKYPTESLTGNGTIDGQPVRCISPEWMVKFHSGYDLKEKDFKDVSALCEKFGIPLPDEYARFR